MHDGPQCDCVAGSRLAVRASPGCCWSKQQRIEGRTHLLGQRGRHCHHVVWSSLSMPVSGPRADANWTTLIFMLYAAGTLTLIPILKRQAVIWAGAARIARCTDSPFCFNTWFADRLAALQISPARPLLLAVLTARVDGGVLRLGVACRTTPQTWSRFRRRGQGVHTCLAAAIATGRGSNGRTHRPLCPLRSCLLLSVHHGAYAACVAVIWAIAAGMTPRRSAGHRRTGCRHRRDWVCHGCHLPCAKTGPRDCRTFAIGSFNCPSLHSGACWPRPFGC